MRIFATTVMSVNIRVNLPRASKYTRKSDSNKDVQKSKSVKTNKYLYIMSAEIATGSLSKWVIMVSITPCSA